MRSIQIKSASLICIFLTLHNVFAHSIPLAKLCQGDKCRDQSNLFTTTETPLDETRTDATTEVMPSVEMNINRSDEILDKLDPVLSLLDRRDITFEEINSTLANSELISGEIPRITVITYNRIERIIMRKPQVEDDSERKRGDYSDEEEQWRDMNYDGDNDDKYDDRRREDKEKHNNHKNRSHHDHHDHHDDHKYRPKGGEHKDKSKHDRHRHYDYDRYYHHYDY